jgi:short-subunit dehydrogenase
MSSTDHTSGASARPARSGAPDPLVFITGASSGIGQAMALHYQRKGWRLALCARRVSEMKSWASALGISASSYEVYDADVGHIDSIVAAGKACIQRQGVPDVVIASAGLSVGIDTADRGDLDEMARLFAINTVGMAATFHPFVAAMKARGSGSLVGMASVAGIRGLPGHGGYSASKAAVIAYCESLRGELRGSGVRVTTIAPGYIDTPLTKNNRYSMPFLMSADDFAQKALVAIEAGASYRVIPWQMGVISKILRALPAPFFDRLMQGRARKRRRGETG